MNSHSRLAFNDKTEHDCGNKKLTKFYDHVPKKNNNNMWVVFSGNNSADDHGRAMKKSSFISLLTIGLMSGVFALNNFASAQDAERQMIVEDIPSLSQIHKVSATKTPSGFPVPRYVSLKYSEVNGRTGPSLKHPIAWQYQRRGLPLIIVAETEMWRKVRDFNGDESWMRKPALSGERTTIVMENADIHSKPRENSRVVAVASRNSVLHLEHCGEEGYCKVRSASGHKGWVPHYVLWGTASLN